MSFRIHASGTTRARAPLFRYERNGLDVGDVYDTVEALATMTSVARASRPARDGMRAGLRSSVVDGATDGMTMESPHRQATTAMADGIGVHLLATNFTLLFASCTPLNLHIAVRSSHALWPDSGGNASYLFLASEGSPAQRMFTRLDQILEPVEMNGFGVLSALAGVFARYAGVAGRGADGQYRLLVTITR